MHLPDGDWRAIVNNLEDALVDAQMTNDKLLIYFVERALFHAQGRVRNQQNRRQQMSELELTNASR